MTKPKGPSEFQICSSIWEHYQKRRLPGTFMAHLVNEGKRSPVTGSRLRSIGLVSGLPDYLIVVDSHAFFMEVKTSAGRLSERQKIVMDQIEGTGADVMVCHGIDACLEHLEFIGAIREEMVVNPFRKEILDR